jgi:Mechanosensitive ion channel, conserved TM helix
MIATLRTVLENAVQRLDHLANTYLPSLLAALTIVLVAYLAALFTRWLIYRIFKGMTIDKFLRQSGIAFMVDSTGQLRATRLAAESAYWLILLSGLLLGVNVFGTDLTNLVIQRLVFLLPKLVVAGLILLGGAWLGQYLGRSMLVWAVNENFPSPRRLATVVRILIMFVAVVVAADNLNFARSVFLAAFIIFVGGAVLAASLAIGLGRGRGSFERFLEEKRERAAETGDRSLWSHL